MHTLSMGLIVLRNSLCLARGPAPLRMGSTNPNQGMTI